MNKKNVFIGVTAVTVVAAAGVVYYRHVLLSRLDKRLQALEEDPELSVFLEDMTKGDES